MYKVITTFRGSGVQTEIELKDYSTAFDLAEKIKKLGEDDVTVKIETDKTTILNGVKIKSTKVVELEEDEDGFTKFILNRFTRRD